MAEAAGSSLLTEAAPPPPPVEDTPPPTESEVALRDVQEGPPEWAVGKFWNVEEAKRDYAGYVSRYAEEVSKGYKNAEQLIGRDKVPKPLSDDDEEGWSRWYAAAGRPETPDKYEFERPKELPEDLPYDEDAEKNFRTWAHINGLNPKQARNLYDAYVKTQVERHAAYHTHQKQIKSQAEMAMRREYGQQYDSAINSARTAVKQYADEDFYAYLDQTGLGNDPRMIRIFAKIGREMSGDTRLNGRPAQPEVNPADAERAISQFREKHQSALYDRAHPDHDRLVKEMNQLFEKAYPDQRQGMF